MLNSIFEEEKIFDISVLTSIKQKTLPVVVPVPLAT
jgi:hypothetical protein